MLMNSLRPVLFAAVGFVALFGLIVISLRRGLPHWWRSRAVRWALAFLVGSTVIGLSIWLGGSVARYRGVSAVGIHSLWILLAFILPLTFALVVAGVFWRVASFALLRKPATAEATTARSKISRRAVVQWGTAAIPATALAASTSGLVSARSEPTLSTLPMRFAKLPPDLEGLRILQLTDLHLGPYRKVSDLEWVLAQATRTKPDLIVFTGDIADDLAMLGPALRLAAEQKPRLGVFASVGNHEYFRSITQVRRIVDASPVALLLDHGASIPVGSSTLYIAGADDPARSGGGFGGDVDGFLTRSVDRALDGAPSDAFHLMLSHRPDGFVASSARGVDLTLSGHTHGGQVGLFGRSAFEPIWPGKYLRGEYVRGGSRLYTSAGFGHWFPFRLNCAPEAPTIVLARA